MTNAATTEEKFVPSDPEEFTEPYESKNVTLPSGRRAVVRRPNTFFLGKTGQVPERVKKASATRQKARDAGETEQEGRRLSADESLEQAAAADAMADFLVAKSFVRPRCTLAPTKGTVCIHQVSADDKAYVIEVLELEV